MLGQPNKTGLTGNGCSVVPQSRSPEQGIDTTTAEGRTMLGMHSVLAEPQRELIIANARDGLAARAADELVGTASQRSTPDPCTTTAQTPGPAAAGWSSGTCRGGCDPAGGGLRWWCLIGVVLVPRFPAGFFVEHRLVAEE